MKQQEAKELTEKALAQLEAQLNRLLIILRFGVGRASLDSRRAPDRP